MKSLFLCTCILWVIFAQYSNEVEANDAQVSTDTLILCVPLWDGTYYPETFESNDESIPGLISQGAFFQAKVYECQQYGPQCQEGPICSNNGECVNGVCQCNVGFTLVDGTCVSGTGTTTTEAPGTTTEATGTTTEATGTTPGATTTTTEATDNTPGTTTTTTGAPDNTPGTTTTTTEATDNTPGTTTTTETTETTQGDTTTTTETTETTPGATTTTTAASGTCGQPVDWENCQNNCPYKGSWQFVRKWLSTEPPSSIYSGDMDFQGLPKNSPPCTFASSDGNQQCSNAFSPDLPKDILFSTEEGVWMAIPLIILRNMIQEAMQFPGTGVSQPAIGCEAYTHITVQFAQQGPFSFLFILATNENGQGAATLWFAQPENQGLAPSGPIPSSYVFIEG